MKYIYQQTTLIIITLLLIITIISCDDDNPAQPEDGDRTPMEELSIADDFAFNTPLPVNLQITVQAPNNSPLAGILVETSIIPAIRGVTNIDGQFECVFAMPAYSDHINARVSLIGAVNLAEITIAGGQAQHTFGGSGNLNQASRHCRPQRGDSGFGIDQLTHFPEPTNTGNNMLVLITQIRGIEVDEGAELGCFTPAGLIAGADTLDPAEESWGMAVWGNDASSDEIDGFQNGEPLRFVYWDPQQQEELDAHITIMSGENAYSTNGFIIIELDVEGGGGFRFRGGTWNEDGVPNYLDRWHEHFDAQFIHRLSLTLPEQVDLRRSYPEYIRDEANLAFEDTAVVGISFLHEGIERRNAVGFYTYPTGNPPQSVDDIDDLTIVFPNASFTDNGRGLESGNRVHLGVFYPNETIGWFLITDGWDGQDVGEGSGMFYSNSSLNTERSDELKKHTIMLFDQETERFILGFEDRYREELGAHVHDFNDVVLAIIITPADAVDLQDIPEIDAIGQQPDRDNDGISDAIDAYPDNNNLAFINESINGTIAFEDNWPNVDDYDFNDLVMTHRFINRTNASGLAMEIEGIFGIRAVGSTLRNGFGFQLPIAPELVQQVTGTRLNHGYINLDGNGLEAGQSNAVVIVTDDVLSHIMPPGGFRYVHTEPGSPWVATVLIPIVIQLTQPVSIAELGLPPYNPFIIIDGQRDHEVHAADYPNTDLADVELFGQENDTSDPGASRYYKSEHNLPWALIMSGQWNHVIEGAALNQGYPNFGPWAESSGGVNKNWYLHNQGNFIEEYIWVRE